MRSYRLTVAPSAARLPAITNGHRMRHTSLGSGATGFRARKRGVVVSPRSCGYGAGSPVSQIGGWGDLSCERTASRTVTPASGRWTGPATSKHGMTTIDKDHQWKSDFQDQPNQSHPLLIQNGQITNDYDHA